MCVGGLMFKQSGSNLQYVTAINFLLATYSKYMSASKHTFNCGDLEVTPHSLRTLVKQQVTPCVINTHTHIYTHKCFC